MENSLVVGVETIGEATVKRVGISESRGETFNQTVSIKHVCLFS